MNEGSIKVKKLKRENKIVMFLISLITITVLMEGSYGQERSIIHNSLIRTYKVHLPPLYDSTSAFPLVLVLHCAGKSGEDCEIRTRFSTKADSENFITVYPNGTGLTSPHYYWNSGRDGCYPNEHGIDDVGFFSTLIDTLLQSYSIDPNRVFVTGFSNGAGMTYRLAAELSDKIAAIAPVACQMLVDNINPVRAVPIIHFHALYDGSAPFNGGSSGCDRESYFPPVESGINQWIQINSCSSTADTIYNNNNIIGRKLSGNSNDADIILYTLAESGHFWPVNQISATDIIWEFFKNHPMNSQTTIKSRKNSKSNKNFVLRQNYPNPFNSSTTIHYMLKNTGYVKLTIFNLLGEEIKNLVDCEQLSGDYEIHWNAGNLPSGIYICCLQTDIFIATQKLVLIK